MRCYNNLEYNPSYVQDFTFGILFLERISVKWPVYCCTPGTSDQLYANAAAFPDFMRYFA